MSTLACQFKVRGTFTWEKWHMKKLIILVILAAGIWWGWTRVIQRSGTDFAIDDDGEYVADTKISDGKKVDLEEHLVPGRYTVFFFYADW